MLIPLIHGLSYSIIETQNLCVQRLHFLALLRTFFMDQTFETLIQENETLLLGHLLTRLLADVSEWVNMNRGPKHNTMQTIRMVCPTWQA